MHNFRNDAETLTTKKKMHDLDVVKFTIDI